MNITPHRLPRASLTEGLGVSAVPAVSTGLSSVQTLGNCSLVFKSLRTLPSSVYRKSFACHSYENCRGVGVLFPFWNSPSVDPRTRHSPVATSHLIYFHALTNAQFASPVFSTQYKLPGGVPPSLPPNVQLSNLPTFKPSILGVPLHPSPPSATMGKVLVKSQETTPPLPVSKKSERTSGPAIVPSRSRVEVEPKVAGRLAIQQRVGKAGSVRLG
jgi:hypothetical protein